MGFLPLLGRVSQDTSYVLVHGVSSCALGCCNIICYGLSKRIKWNELHAYKVKLNFNMLSDLFWRE
jgi:hypothetical protein